MAGTVKVGKSSWIGTGASVTNNINICANCMIGAGAVVIKDIDEAGTYVGIPAERVTMGRMEILDKTVRWSGGLIPSLYMIDMQNFSMRRAA